MVVVLLKTFFFLLYISIFRNTNKCCFYMQSYIFYWNTLKNRTFSVWRCICSIGVALLTLNIEEYRNIVQQHRPRRSNKNSCTCTWLSYVQLIWRWLSIESNEALFIITNVKWMNGLRYKRKFLSIKSVCEIYLLIKLTLKYINFSVSNLQAYLFALQFFFIRFFQTEMSKGHHKWWICVISFLYHMFWYENNNKTNKHHK